MYWNLSVIIICFLLLLFLLWKEITRSNKSRLTARIIASVLAVISLAFLALPLAINYKQKNNSAKNILLTKGFNSDSVQTILNAEKNAKVFTTDKNIKAFNAAYISGTDTFSTSSYNTKTLHVFGYGLDENDLSLLKNTPVVFHSGPIENKVTSINWTTKLALGEPLIVQGSFNNTTSSTVKIILSGFETNLDSIIIPAKQPSYFQLRALPQNLDKAVYSLTVLSGKDTLEKEPIPVEVKATQPFSILILSASPDFENKFLHSWLAQNEYKFSVRTSISKNKFDKQFANMPPVSLNRITPSLLEIFDVVIADASELSALSSSEISSIKNALDANGIGLIVKADSTKNSSAFYSNSFPLVETRDSIQHIIKLNLNDSSHSLSPLKTEQPIYIRNVTNTQPLVKDQQMHIVANSKMYGAGKIIYATISNTYNWELSGNNNDYSAYWSWLLQKAAKKNPLQNVWNITPALPQKNQEVHLKLQTQNENIPQPQALENMLYAEQNYLLPYEWNATYWPATTGWQSLINNGETNYWYAYFNEDWLGVKALDKINATKKYAALHIYQAAQNSLTNVETKFEIPKFYFFFLFILAAGFLWFEKKYMNG